MEFKRMRGALVIMFLMSGALKAELSSVPTVSLSTYTTVPMSSPSPSAFIWRSVPNTAIRPDEAFSFIVKWGLVTAGYSTLSVKGIDTINGRPAYHIVEEAKSGKMVGAFYRVEDENSAWMDTQALISVKFEKHIKEGKYQIEEVTTVDQPSGRFLLRSFRVDKNSYEQKEGTVTINVQDVLSSLYYVRTLPLEVGKIFIVDVLSGDKLYPLEVKVKKRETIKVPAGKFDTFLVQPLLRAPGIFVAKGKKLEVWLTTDSRHVPVRMRSEIFIGHVSAELLPEQEDDISDAP